MQTKNIVVAELETILNAAPNGIEDHLNNTLSDYPAVWDVLFEGGTTASDEELTAQAIDAKTAVADLIAELS